MEKIKIMKKITDERIKHMHGVAEYMFEHASEYNLDKNEMYVLGLLHDIGYVNGAPFHESFGANMLNSLGLPLHITEAINWHGSTPAEYKESYECSDSEIPKPLVLLWQADLHVDQSGEDVGFKARLDDIGNRHGFDSINYKKCHETIDWLTRQFNFNLI